MSSAGPLARRIDHEPARRPALTQPGRVLTRHTIAVGGGQDDDVRASDPPDRGRIETHFHVFGSLAFLAFYRDWRVLVTATVVVAWSGRNRSTARRRARRGGPPRHNTGTPSSGGVRVAPRRSE